MRAKVGFAIFEIDGAFTSGADAFGEPRQGGVVTQLFAALGVGHKLGEFLAFEVPVKRQNGVAPDQRRDGNAHHVPHVPAVTRQIRHQLHKKCKQREEDEAPNERPIGAFAFLHEEPARHRQHWQGQRQPVQKHAQFLCAQGLVPSRLRGVLRFL